MSCSASCYDRCDQCKKDFCQPHFVEHHCNDECDITAPTRKRRPKRITAKNDCRDSSEMTATVQSSSTAVFDQSAVPDVLPVEIKKKTKKGKSSAKVQRKKSTPLPFESEDSDEHEDMPTSSSIQRTQTRTTGRPIRQAAVKANKLILLRDDEIDYHEHPEVLYGQIVHRYCYCLVIFSVL